MSKKNFKIKKTIVPLLKYGIVGAFITLLDLFVVIILTEYNISNIIFNSIWGFIVANITGFILNKTWTFQNKANNLIHQYVKYLTVSIFGLLLTVFFMWFFNEKLSLFHSISTQYNYIFCKLLTSCIVLIWNFIGNKLWTFSEAIRLHPRIRPARNYRYDLSIIIPAFNEATRIIDTLKKIFQYIEHHHIDAEVIVVDDGSQDCTYKVCQNIFKYKSNFRIIRNPQNNGKGFAIKTGIQNAFGEYLLLTDADNSTPIEEFEKFRDHLTLKSIIIGSRYIDPTLVKVQQPFYRILISRLANWIIQLFLIDGIKDT